MKRVLADVTAFHEQFGQPIREAVCRPAPDRVRLRRDLVEEECDELSDALEQLECLPPDSPCVRAALVDAADAMADLVYVIAGAALEFGIPLDRVWDEVHRSNMAKAGGGRRVDGKILKPKGWKPPNVDGVLYPEGGR